MLTMVECICVLQDELSPAALTANRCQKYDKQQLDSLA